VNTAATGEVILAAAGRVTEPPRPLPEEQPEPEDTVP